MDIIDIDDDLIAQLMKSPVEEEIAFPTLFVIVLFLRPPGTACDRHGSS